MKHEWPLVAPGAMPAPVGLPATVGLDGPATDSAPADQNISPLLPLAFNEDVELIKAGRAIDAFARRRVGQMRSHGHTPENDLTKPIGAICNEARWRLAAVSDFVGRDLMNLPRGRREQCIRHIESAGAVLISLWDRVHAELPE